MRHNEVTLHCEAGMAQEEADCRDMPEGALVRKTDWKNPETCPPVVREMRLELTRLGCQNLNLVRLPIPPLPRKNKNSNETNPTQLTGVT